MIVMISLDDIFRDIWEKDGEALFSSKYPEQLFVFKECYLNSLPVPALGLYRGLHLGRSASLLEIVGICRKVAEKAISISCCCFDLFENLILVLKNYCRTLATVRTVSFVRYHTLK
jgi:hypothetical protein